MHSSQENQLGEGDPADTPQLLKGDVKVELADLYQQNDEEDSQRGGRSPNPGAAHAHWRGLSPRMLRKKLLKVICTPMVSANTEGITMRSVCSISSAPKLSFAQPDTAKM